LIIKEIRPPQPPPPPPLYIRKLINRNLFEYIFNHTGQRPPLPPTLPPIVIREAPPKVPAAVGTQSMMSELISKREKSFIR
jgi:hypothetical protein